MNRIGIAGHGACAVFGAFNHGDIDLVVVPEPIPPRIAWRGHKVCIGAGVRGARSELADLSALA